MYVYIHIGAKTRISRARKHGATALDRPWGRHTRRTRGRHRSGQPRNVKWAPRWEARTCAHSLSVPGKLLVTLLTGKWLESCVARKCEVTHEPRNHESAACGEARTRLHSRFVAGKMLVAYVKENERWLTNREMTNGRLVERLGRTCIPYLSQENDWWRIRWPGCFLVAPLACDTNWQLT